MSTLIAPIDAHREREIAEARADLLRRAEAQGVKPITSLEDLAGDPEIARCFGRHGDFGGNAVIDDSSIVQVRRPPDEGARGNDRKDEQNFHKSAPFQSQLSEMIVKPSTPMK